MGDVVVVRGIIGKVVGCLTFDNSPRLLLEVFNVKEEVHSAAIKLHPSGEQVLIDLASCPGGITHMACWSEVGSDGCIIALK